MNDTDRTVRMRCAGATLIALGQTLQTCSSEHAKVLSITVDVLEEELRRLSDLLDDEAPSPNRAAPSKDGLPF